MESLSDEAVEQLAKELLIEAAEHIRFPENVFKYVTEDGELQFACVCSGENTGEATVIYSPLSAAKFFVKASEESFIRNFAYSTDAGR